LVFVAILMISSLLNIAYLLPIPIRAFFPGTPDRVLGEPLPASASVAAAGGHDDAGGIHEAPFLMVLPLMLTAVGCIILFFLAGPIYDLLTPIAQTR